ncbi:MAG: PstS family phosphate ABC transporter substrate-binding protein [Polyangiales bacterium]
MTSPVNRRLFVSALATIALAACTRENPAGAPAAATSGSAGSSAAAAAPKAAGPLTVKGSDTMVGLSQKWAEVYMNGHAGTSIQVTGGGTGTGIAALINGATDLCNASRPLSDKEKIDIKAKRGVDAVETKVALDALAVYVNDKSPVTEIDLETLAQIYLGNLTDWKDVPGGKAHKITLYGRENNSGTYGYFKEHVLAKKDFAPEVQTLSGTAAVANAVKGDEFGIGYGGVAYASGIRLLKVKKTKADPAIEPKKETAIDGTYPISRFLYIDTAGAPTGTAKLFIDWMLSDAGQKVVDDIGYFPLPK